MDVAATLRKERALVDAQLNIQQIKAALRERLLEGAKISGDPVTAAEIDAAVEQYYSQLHEFRDPPASFAKFVAHVWVLRATLIKAAIAAVAATGMLWSVLALMLLLALFPREVKPPIVSRPGQPTSRYSMHQPGMPVAAGLAPSPGRGGPFIVC